MKEFPIVLSRGTIWAAKWYNNKTIFTILVALDERVRAEVSGDL